MTEIKILNPIPGDRRFTTSTNAAKLVKRGKAQYISEFTIRFTENKSGWLKKAMDEAKIREYEKTTGYERRGILTRKEVQALPVVCVIKLTTLPTKMRHYDPRERNGAVKIIYSRDSEKQAL